MRERSSDSREAQGVHATPPSVCIRTAASADAAMIAAFLARNPGGSAGPRRPARADIELLLSQKTSGMLVAEVADRAVAVVGYARDGATLRLFDLTLAAAATAFSAEAPAADVLAAVEEIARTLGVALVAAQAMQPSREFNALAAAGYVVDAQEMEAAGGDVVAVADLIKLL